MIDALMFERAAASQVKNCEAAASFFRLFVNSWGGIC